VKSMATCMNRGNKNIVPLDGGSVSCNTYPVCSYLRCGEEPFCCVVFIFDSKAVHTWERIFCRLQELDSAASAGWLQYNLPKQCGRRPRVRLPSRVHVLLPSAPRVPKLLLSLGLHASGASKYTYS
jgi:hypothetical protein